VNIPQYDKMSRLIIKNLPKSVSISVTILLRHYAKPALIKVIFGSCSSRICV